MVAINISVDSWIIRDGNYDDFTLGQEAAFALEFYPGEIKRTRAAEKSFRATGPFEYEVVAEVLYRSEKTWVIDFGLMAYDELKDPEYKKGDWIAGTLTVGIDPFFYTEDLKDEPGIPWLKYKFRIDEILLNTTPWIEEGHMKYRDANRISFQPVPKTDASNDDDGGGYVFKCSVLELPSSPNQGKPPGLLSRLLKPR